MAEATLTNRGRELLARWVTGETITTPKYIGIGLSDRDLSITETELGDEYYRAEATSIFRIEPQVARFSLVLGPNTPPTADVLKIREIGLFDEAQVALTNPGFEEWDTIPTGWTIKNATVTKETTNVFEGSASCKVEPTDTGWVYQELPNPERWRGKEIVFRLAVYTTTLFAYVFIEDDISRTEIISPKTLAWTVVKVKRTIDANATFVRVGFRIGVSYAIIDWGSVIAPKGNLWARALVKVDKQTNPLATAFQLRLLAPEEEEIMALIAFAKEELTVSNTVVTLTPSVYQPTGEAPAEEAFITGEEGNVRYWLDGTDPTAESGHLLEPGMFYTIRGLTNITQMKMIRAGTTDAKVKVTYFR